MSARKECPAQAINVSTETTPLRCREDGQKSADFHPSRIQRDSAVPQPVVPTRPAEREFGPRQMDNTLRRLACSNASIGRLCTPSRLPFHRKMERHLADMVEADPGIKSVHFWELLDDGKFKNIFWIEYPGQSRREPFIPAHSPLAQRVLAGEMAVFDGNQMELFSRRPGDYMPRDGNGLGSPVLPGCWVPVYTGLGVEMKITHMLSAEGEFIGTSPEHFARQEFISIMSRVMGLEYGLLERGRDPLTGLYDVKFFRRHLIRACIDSILRRKSFGVGHIDLDEFKHVNDTHGHMAGDDALVLAGSILQAFSSTSGRLGGDELALILYGLSDSHALEEKAFELHCQLNPVACKSGTGEVHVTASCGMSGSFQWEALKGVRRFPDGPKKEMLENIRQMLDQMPKLREEAEPEILRLRKANRSPDTFGDALEAYAKAWGELLLSLAEISSYLIKITGRNGIAMPVVEGDTLSFKIICRD